MKMSLISRIFFGFIVALVVGIVTYLIAATIAVWLTFFATPSMWMEWNMITLPFQYSFDWGYFNPFVQLITIVVMVIVFFGGAATLD